MLALMSKKANMINDWTWYYVVGIDVKNINMVLSLYVFEILKLKRDNVVGCVEDMV